MAAGSEAVVARNLMQDAERACFEPFVPAMRLNRTSAERSVAAYTR
jgi:hypothetical protein